MNNNGMTVKEVARAFEVTEKQVEKEMIGQTTQRNEQGEIIVFWQDIQVLRYKFVYGKDYPFFDQKETDYECKIRVLSR